MLKGKKKALRPLYAPLEFFLPTLLLAGEPSRWGELLAEIGRAHV